MGPCGLFTLRLLLRYMVDFRGRCPSRHLPWSMWGLVLPICLARRPSSGRGPLQAKAEVVDWLSETSRWCLSCNPSCMSKGLISLTLRLVVGGGGPSQRHILNLNLLLGSKAPSQTLKTWNFCTDLLYAEFLQITILYEFNEINYTCHTLTLLFM